MQFYALSKNGLLCAAPKALRQKDYYCIECKKTVRVRGGHHKRLHYYHLEKTKGCRQNGKSLTHLEIQLHLQALFSNNILIEEPFPTIQRIADCAHHEKKLIFEIQCSFITAKEVKARTEDYKSLGYNVIWILHDKRFNRYRLTGAELFLQDRMHFYTNMNELGEGVIYSQRVRDVGAFRLFRSTPTPVDLREIELPDVKKERESFLRRVVRRLLEVVRFQNR